MIELILNNTRVYPDSQLKIKLTRENPYFSDSDSYTLDVSLPTDIFENRRFFSNIQRIERSKKRARMTAVLLADGRSILNGSAIITQVTESAVKVQLLQGYPTLKLLMKDSDDFIDQMEMDSGIDPNASRHISPSASFKAQGVKGQHVYLPIYNESTDKIMNKYHYDQDENDVVYSNMVDQDLAAVQPNLLYVLGKVFAHYGFKLDAGSYNQEPWTAIYVANCKATRSLSKALPHWRSSDFFTEAANFFCAKFLVDEVAMTVTMVSLKESASDSRTVIEPVYEYEADVDEEQESEDLLSSNISYAVSSSIFHEWDIISQEVVDSCQPIEYSTLALLKKEDDASPHHNNILVCPTGCFAWWERKSETTTPPCRRNKGLARMQVNQFGTLVRDSGSDKSIELKICPVAMTDKQHLNDKKTSYYIYTHMPSMSEYEYEATAFEDMTAQERIESAMTVDEDEDSSSDLMEVFFFDNTFMRTSYQNTAISHDYVLQLPMAFTDAESLKSDNPGGSHSSWSMALDHCGCSKFVGQLHQAASSFDSSVTLQAKFLSDDIPDPRNIFVIHGKCYGCQKIEADVTSDGIDKLMTGYFYEMLS